MASGYVQRMVAVGWCWLDYVYCLFSPRDSIVKINVRGRTLAFHIQSSYVSGQAPCDKIPLSLSLSLSLTYTHFFLFKLSELC